MVETKDVDIFSDKEKLLRIWEKERETRDLAVKLMWENLKYFGAIIGALFAVYSTFLDHYFSTLGTTNLIINSIELLLIPITVIVLSLFARNDLQARRRRFYLVVSQLLKLENLLGLHEKIGDKLTYLKYSDDQYLFAEYQKNLIEYKKNYCQCGDEKEFIDSQMKKKSAFLTMQYIYITMVIIASALIFLGTVVLFPSFVNLIMQF